ncbi:hypothetical protein BC938DRAFT_472614 [Jimgerdemannia flammicorona]|uniref:Arrestin-like N-terminal domain-containing protein n=1 Tax=Jimgerdemannia flammicorona TaxID=994334 RepID=A0A433QZW0_9FUNG|nr:hypothetical protein BC938DRAFT_472614 [Jimgerdemannia flammicorona]
MKTIILIFLAWIVAAIGTRGDDEIITPNPRVQVGMLVEHNPVRPNAVVEGRACTLPLLHQETSPILPGKVRLFAKEPYEAFSIYLSFSCVESFTIKTKLDDNAFLADDLQTPLSLLKNYSAVATDEDFDQTNRILSSPTGKWISVREQRILFDTGVYLEINRTEPLYGEHIFPFFLVLPDTNFPPEEKISMDYVDQLHEIKMFSYNIHYGYKVQIRNSTASPVGLAVQTDFTPTVLSPRPSSSAPLTITHTYTCRLPHCTGQYTSTKMLATLPMGDTYALGSDTEFSSCSVPIQVHASKCKILHFIFGRRHHSAHTLLHIRHPGTHRYHLLPRRHRFRALYCASSASESTVVLELLSPISD